MCTRACVYARACMCSVCVCVSECVCVCACVRAHFIVLIIKDILLVGIDKTGEQETSKKSNEKRLVLQSVNYTDCWISIVAVTELYGINNNIFHHIIQIAYFLNDPLFEPLRRNW